VTLRTLKTLRWLARELRPLLARPPRGGPSYAVSVWCGERRDAFADDHGPFGWVQVARGFRAGSWRRVWKHLLDRSFDEPSVYVWREGGDE
jgi:hypothetical protein